MKKNYIVNHYNYFNCFLLINKNLLFSYLSKAKLIVLYQTDYLNRYETCQNYYIFTFIFIFGFRTLLQQSTQMHLFVHLRPFLKH